jgi:RNA polymerase sigma-70 factor (ECF subfamily)
MGATKTDQLAQETPGTNGLRTGPGARGRRAMFEALLLGQLPALTCRARSLEVSAAAAEDLVQDTIERALLNCDRFTLGTNMYSWLMQIMKNLFIDRRRARPRLAEVEELDWYPASVPDLEPPLPWQLVTFGEALQALDQLEEPLRGTFVLACLSGWSYRRVADRLGVPVATVGTRLLRARGHLRALLQAQLTETDGVWSRRAAPEPRSAVPEMVPPAPPPPRQRRRTPDRSRATTLAAH